MAQATTTVPAQYGRAYRTFVETALAAGPDELAAVQVPDLPDAAETYEQAVQRVDDALMAVAALDDSTLDGYPPCVVDAAVAVIARDRGLITTADFGTITAPWVAAGYPLPTAVTGDEEAAIFTPLADMTSDRLADALIQAAHADHAHPHRYGAVLMLTGYNQGELLAYESVREYLDLHEGGRLKVDWTSLRRDVLRGPIDDQMTAEAQGALEFAANLPHPDDDEDDARFFAALNADTAEAMVFALGYVIGAEGALNPYDPDLTPGLAVPPRQVRSEPTS